MSDQTAGEQGGLGHAEEQEEKHTCRSTPCPKKSTRCTDRSTLLSKMFGVLAVEPRTLLSPPVLPLGRAERGPTILGEHDEFRTPPTPRGTWRANSASPVRVVMIRPIAAGCRGSCCSLRSKLHCACARCMRSLAGNEAGIVRKSEKSELILYKAL